MTTNSDAEPVRDLIGRSWAALGIGLALAVLGAIVLNTVAGSFDPSPIATIVGTGLAILGGMTVQASIVGFVFGSYDGIRPRRRPPISDDPDAERRRAPGWYPDPDEPTRERWWDGARWTETRPVTEPD